MFSEWQRQPTYIYIRLNTYVYMYVYIHVCVFRFTQFTYIISQYFTYICIIYHISPQPNASLKQKQKHSCPKISQQKIQQKIQQNHPTLPFILTKNPHPNKGKKNNTKTLPDLWRVVDVRWHSTHLRRSYSRPG